MFAPEFIQGAGAAHAPFPRSETFEHELADLLAAKAAESFFKNILHRHKTRCASEFIQNDRDAALLALQTAEELQQVHGLRNERRKFNHFLKFSIWIEEERARVQH